MVMLLSTFPRSADAADNQHWLDRKGPAGYFILKFGKGDLVDPDQLDKGGKLKATEYVIFKKTLHHAASMSSRGTKCYLTIVRPEIESPGFALRSPQEVIPRLRLLKTSWQHVARTPEAHVFREYNKRHIEKMWSSLDQPSPNLVRIHLELPWMHKEASYEDDVLYKVAFPCVDALEEFECNFPLELDGLERIHAHLKDFKFFLDRFSFVVNVHLLKLEYLSLDGTVPQFITNILTAPALEYLTFIYYGWWSYRIKQSSTLASRSWIGASVTGACIQGPSKCRSKRLPIPMPTFEA
ncbi:SubName: Full=Uncharacterized protein {ECO:0000313/EMBL:CCA73388.1} [Serendipita indica DSM 11827]|nr:SubName: Full=Uncharacterized protein {ECO:0000313/EMBL:CCA73388.1} [Serendipita indica DSM 11827]